MNSMLTQAAFQKDLHEVLSGVENLLISKNIKYGDAALNPNQTFSKSDAVELIRVRIDDKLSRIRNRTNDEDEDPELDLLGYLVLLRIAKKRAFEAETQRQLDQEMVTGSGVRDRWAGPKTDQKGL